jgi:hypothetical protein
MTIDEGWVKTIRWKIAWLCVRLARRSFNYKAGSEAKPISKGKPGKFKSLESMRNIPHPH